MFIITKKDIEHLVWIKSRLVNVYKENENVDFIIRLGSIINKLKDYEVIKPTRFQNILSWVGHFAIGWMIADIILVLVHN